MIFSFELIQYNWRNSTCSRKSLQKLDLLIQLKENPNLYTTIHGGTITHVTMTTEAGP
jgi:hypothetical protein